MKVWMMLKYVPCINATDSIVHLTDICHLRNIFSRNVTPGVTPALDLLSTLSVQNEVGLYEP